MSAAQFLESLNQQIALELESRTAEDYRSATSLFFDRVKPLLIDSGEVGDVEECPFDNGDAKLAGYYFDDKAEVEDTAEDGGTQVSPRVLSLLLVDYCEAETPQPIYADQRSDKSRREGRNDLFGKMRTFLTQALNGKMHGQIEESDPAHQFAREIRDHRDEWEQIRLYLITNRISKETGLVAGSVVAGDNSIDVSYVVYDLDRLGKLWFSKEEREKIAINFEAEFGQAIPCVRMPLDNSVYCTYLAMLPGKMLADIYERYGTRLLERNVRSFLQFKGDINRGLRDTIRDTPEFFLAYNNGLTIAVTSLETATRNGQLCILSTEDFQIVNGGQTTAAIFHTSRKDKVDLSRVLVQAKVTEIRDKTVSQDLTRRISRFANSQNKVRIPDLFANDSYHVALENFSRSEPAPRQADEAILTYWYYERARGQYYSDLFREDGAAKQRKWKLEHPLTKLFTKTDLAKYELAWGLKPHFVCRGGEYAFSRFMEMIDTQDGLRNVTREDYHSIVARGILFRRTDAIIKSLDLGEYKAQKVAYTVAFLVKCSQGRISLRAIWNKQALSEALEAEIGEIAQLFSGFLNKQFLRSTNEGKPLNLSQYCKKAACWADFVEANPHHHLNDALKEELTAVGPVPPTGATLTPAEEALIEKVKGMYKLRFLKNLITWNRSVRFLDAQQEMELNLVFTTLKERQELTPQYAGKVLAMFEAAMSNGFKP